MFTRGEFTADNVTYGAVLSYTKSRVEAILVTSGTVVSAYLVDDTGSYSYNNVRAKEFVKLIQSGVKGCTSKNCVPMPFELGAMNQHEFIKSKVEYTMQMYRGEVVGAFIQSADKRIEVEYIQDFKMPTNINYVKLTEVKKNFNVAEDDLDAIQTRSVQEIALEKEDVSWLRNKKYFIVNDDEQAEQIFAFLDQYNGPIAYDTETTGLKINVFGQINSKYQHDLEEYNKEHSDNPIRADKLVGIIFCVEENTSYYFPCFNRKFKNLYQDLDSPIRQRIINNTKAMYTIGSLRDKDNCVAEYWRKTPADEITSDCILMERVRNILETKHIVAHNGSFEYKVGLQYWIDTNLKDDTMIMHQVAYKFRNGGGKAEPSNLKYLAKKELGVDQWELHDFFPNWKPDKDGLVRRKPGTKNLGTQIDFSYMDYEGTRVYAPTDGDVTLGLFHKFKADLLANHKEMEYIYNVEVIVACAIGYMEFFGHRIDESKILNARAETMANKSMIVSEIRQMIDYSDEKELDAYNEIKLFRDNKKESGLSEDEFNSKLIELVAKLDGAIEANTQKQINLGSSAQVCDLFYNKLGIPFSGDKQSVAKKEVKALLKEKNDDGTPKYPVVHLYSKYKNEETLLSKFFDNLIYFTYPGGFIFSSFGQIATNTGRMSCIEENTPIKVVGGDKPIKDIKVGDLVYCYDDNLNIRIRKVTNVIDKGYKECIKLNWKSQGTHSDGELICTPDHKILTKDNGWINAIDTVGDKVVHLRRSATNVDRPVLYGTNGFYKQEQIIIKKELFGVEGYNNVIHHKDNNTLNNTEDNFEIKSRSEHSSKHSKELVKQGRIKYDHLLNCKHRVLSGKEHPRYIDISYDELRQKFLDAGCIIKNVDMDFTTFKKKCEEVGYDYKEDMIKTYPNLAVEDNDILYAFSKHGTVNGTAKELGISRWKVEKVLNKAGILKTDIGVSDDEFRDIFFKNEGNVSKIAKELGIHRSYIINTVNRLNLCYNHNIVSYEEVGIRHVYDIEVEEFHNFIANEICVHNCSKPNCQQYPKVITKIIIPRDGYVMMDADYSQIEYRVLTAMAGNEGLAELFSNPDSDYHTLMASLMYDVDYSAVTGAMRSAAKSFNFGIPYGMGLGSLAILLTGKNTPQTRDEAAEKMEDYFRNQPKTRKFFDNVKEMAQVNGYTKTLFNRYRYYSFTDKDGNVNNAKKAAALRQAGNAVIQGTAADIFKIGVARNFSFIRRNGLLGKLLIINMIHDEQLMEIDAQSLNVQRIVAEVGQNMQFKIDGFPPLYIGAGLGKAWGYAKGKMAEIHPDLLAQLTEEAKTIPIWRTPEQIEAEPYVEPNKVLDYFDNRVYEFRRKKVADYLSNPENWHKAIYPAISGLINLQFNYGRGDDAKAYVGPNGETYTDQEFLELNIGDFLKENNIDADPSWFKAGDNKAEDEEEDKEYSEGELDEDDMLDSVEGDEDVKSFTIIDESDKTFGSSVHDMINIFGACILPQQRICGISTKNMYYKKKDALIDYLMQYMCESDDPDGLQIVFLNDVNVLNYTGVYVKNLDNDKLEQVYKNANNTGSDFTQGDVQNRSQAK